MSPDTETELDRVRRMERFQTFGLTDPDEVQRLLSTMFVGESGEDAERVEPVRRTRQRKPTVASVIRQMKRAGVEIAGCEINPRDGTVRVITGKPVGASDIDMGRSPDPKWN